MMYCSSCDMPRDKQHFCKADQDAAEQGKDENFVCLHCSGGKPLRSAEDAAQYHCHGILCLHQKHPHFHFIQADLTRWKQDDVLEPIPKCARCVVYDDSDSAGVEFKCLNCQKKKHVSDFNPVTI